MSAIRSRIIVAVVAVGALASAALVTAPAAVAATLTVSNPGGGGSYTSIQAAVNAAHNGDTVSVAAGTYVGQVVLNKYVTLIGAGRDTTTIQSPGGSQTTMFIQYVPFVPGGQVTVKGFTIKGGNGPCGQAGGITIAPNADPVISDNTITDNHAQCYGGGIAIEHNSSPLIRNNNIVGNSSVDGGGGIFAVDNSSPIIYGNQITNNATTGAAIPNGGSSGGGVYLENNAGGGVSYPVVMNNTISNNSADFAGGGIMLRTGVAAMIFGNTVDHNVAPYGAGIHAETNGSSVTIESNTITNNRASAANPSSGDGGGISAYAGSVVTIRDNTISGNQASNAGGGIVIAEGSSVTVQANTITNNLVGPAYSPSTYAEGGGVYVANASLTAYNNVVTGNSADLGGAFAMLDNSSSNIDSNTIVSNSEHYAQGGAVFYASGALGGGSLSNNIIYANTLTQVFEIGVHGTKRNNLIDPANVGTEAYDNYTKYITAQDLNNNGGTLAAANNFSGNPMFTNASAGDYSLQSSSPAINNSATADVAVVPGDDRRNAIRSGIPDVGAFEYLANPVIKSHVYRFWSTTNQAHFYTMSAAERDVVASSYNPREWRLEQVAYDAFPTQVSGTVPLYRAFSSVLNAHFYTIDPNEYALATGRADKLWSAEGIAYYVYPLQYTGNSSVVYRFWSPDHQHHFYTSSVAERDQVIANYPSHVWTYEGPQFRVP